MNITVIGCGETGATISALLLSKYNEITLNILDPDKKIFGRILDLQHSATCGGSKILWNNFDSASDSDYLFFTAGVRGKKDEERSKKAKQNKALITAIFNEFKPKEHALIITISNPTEAMSYWIFKHLKGKNLVVGTGTSLDTYRLQLLIAKQLQKSIQDVNTLVLAEHGSRMTPIWSQTTVYGKAIGELVNENELKKLTSELKNTAAEIRKTEVATKYGVSQCALTILASYIAPHKTKLAVSFSAEKIKQINRNDIFFSWPCEIGNHSISTVEKIKMNESEKELLEKAADAINTTISL